MEEVFRQEVRHTLNIGFRDLYVFGTAGEGYAVTNEQFKQIVEIFWEETNLPDVYSQVGVIALSTPAAVERLGWAYNLGFRTFQISLPSWGALNDREMLTFFRDVCGAFPDARFLHYNLPRTKRLLTAADYRRVADAVPNLAATKNTGLTVAGVAELMRAVPEVQHFFGEALFPTGCLYGTCSLLSSFGPMLPSKTREFFEYGRTRRFDKLFPFQRDYLTVIEDVLAPMRSTPLIDGAYDKVLVRLGGVNMPLRLLSPYESFSEEVYQECHRILHEKYADWLS